MHIVLHQPEIPSNTGNIGRTCVATGSSLHLIEPLGFRINEKELKRAGMDYWDDLEVIRYTNYEEFLEKNPDAKIVGKVWPEPNSLAKTKPELVITGEFPFTDEGIEELRKWINDQYDVNDFKN